MPSPKPRFPVGLLIAVPIVLGIATAALSPAPKTTRELVEQKLPEMRLVAKETDLRLHVTTWLYTGPADSEQIAGRLNALLPTPGWQLNRKLTGSAFPLSAQYSPNIDRTWWTRLMTWFRRRQPLEIGLDLRVLKGRADARPQGGPWTSIVIRESGYAKSYFGDTSEPIHGHGVYLW